MSRADEVLTFPRTAGPRGGRRPFDKEHCDGCGQLVTRGTVRCVLVDHDAPGITGWRWLCRTCLRGAA